MDWACRPIPSKDEKMARSLLQFGSALGAIAVNKHVAHYIL